MYPGFAVTGVPSTIRPLSEGVTEHVFFRRLDESRKCISFVFRQISAASLSYNYSLRAELLQFVLPLYETIDEILSVNSKKETRRLKKEEYLNWRSIAVDDM